MEAECPIYDCWQDYFGPNCRGGGGGGHCSHGQETPPKARCPTFEKRNPLHRCRMKRPVHAAQASAQRQRRHSAPGAHLGAAFLLDARTPAQNCTPPTCTRMAPIGAASTSAGSLPRLRPQTKAPLGNEGLSYVVHDGKKAFTLREAIAFGGEKLIAPTFGISINVGPSTASFSITSVRSPITCTRATPKPRWWVNKGKPESYYFHPN